MRSRFWLGMISHRDPTITLPEEQVRAMRADGVNAEFARRLHQHCVEEMGYLAEILPVLYRRVTLDNAFGTTGLCAVGCNHTSEVKWEERECLTV